MRPEILAPNADAWSELRYWLTEINVYNGEYSTAINLLETYPQFFKTNEALEDELGKLIQLYEMQESLANNSSLSEAMLNDITECSEDASAIVAGVASSFSIEFSYSPVPLFFPGINAEPRADWMEIKNEKSEPKLYPNPANEFVVLNWLETGKQIHLIEMVDVTGNVLMQVKNIADTFEALLEIKGFAPGVYSIICYGNSGEILFNIPLLKQQ